MARVLHLLSQRPLLTGSGITLEALVREASTAGWEQSVSVGIPQSASHPVIGDLPPEKIHPLFFETPELPFHVPGMSDVMPYPSTRFSRMTPAEIRIYRRAWRQHISRLIGEFKPDLIHSHHLWIMSSILKDIAPSIPVLNHCHATGLRQMQLCRHLEPDLLRDLRRNEVFAVLHEAQRIEVIDKLGLPGDRVSVIGAGYREDLFHCRGRSAPESPQLLYIGKLSHSKGLPQLLQAFKTLRRHIAGLRLEIIGSGEGPESEELRAELLSTSGIRFHGRLQQEEIAPLMRRSSVCVLPSFYEGLPLVLVEAAACGCRLVATALPGIAAGLKPGLGRALELLPLPEMETIDRPRVQSLPAFVDNLVKKIKESLDRPPLASRELQACLENFRWRSVFQRVEVLWARLRGE